jgi:hypothetical protein
VFASLAQCFADKAVSAVRTRVVSVCCLTRRARQETIQHFLRQCLFDDLVEWSARGRRSAPWSDADLRNHAGKLTETVLESARAYMIDDTVRGLGGDVRCMWC